MIQLNPDEEYIKVLNIPSNQLPEGFKEALMFKNCTYMDTVLREHMYSEENLIEEGMEEFIQKYRETVEEIQTLMYDGDYSYFRIINQ